MRVTKIQIPRIPKEEKTPIVSQLVEIIEQQSVIIQQQEELIQQLKDEIARLKGQKPKPKIRPSQLEKNPESKKKECCSHKRPGSDKRGKTANLIIHKTIPVPPERIPPGSIFKGHQPFTVQGIKIEPYNICFRGRSCRDCIIFQRYFFTGGGFPVEARRITHELVTPG